MATEIAARSPRILDAALPDLAYCDLDDPDLVHGSTIAFTDRGEHELKGVSRSWRLFSLTAT